MDKKNHGMAEFKKYTVLTAMETRGIPPVREVLEEYGYNYRFTECYW